MSESANGFDELLLGGRFGLLLLLSYCLILSLLVPQTASGSG